MPPRLPELEPGTRALCAEVVQRLGEELDDLAVAMTDAVIAEIPTYHNMVSPEQWATIHEHSVEHARAVIDCIRTWNLPPLEALGFVKARAAMRATQQLPLSALLHAYRVGHRTVWERLVRILAEFDNPLEASLALTTMTLAYTDLISSALAEGYIESQRGALLHAARARRDLLETLLTGTADTRADTLEVASSFALVPGADFLVIVMTCPEVNQAESETRAAETLRRHLALGVAQPFVVVRQREVVSIAPVARARPSAIARLVRQACAEFGADALAGISTLCAGLGEVARGYQEARQALGSAAACGGVCALLEQRVFEYVLEHADGTAARMIPASARRVLRAEDPLLLETLRTYALAEMSVRDTADALSVHPNTVVYRLEKLSRLLDRDVTRFSNLVEVMTWLRLLGPG
jgi:sugar diacid utilization regulator